MAYHPISLPTLICVCCNAYNSYQYPQNWTLHLCAIQRWTNLYSICYNYLSHGVLTVLVYISVLICNVYQMSIITSCHTWYFICIHCANLCEHDIFVRTQLLGFLPGYLQICEWKMITTSAQWWYNSNWHNNLTMT